MSLRDYLDVRDTQFSYFVHKYSGTTRFQTQTLLVPTDPDTQFGGTSWSVVPHRGDLITRIILAVQFEETNIRFVDGAGTYMIEYADLFFERQLIERVYGEYIELTNDISVPLGKQSELSNVVGKNQQTFSPCSFYLTLPFSFVRRGLPLAAFAEDMKIEVRIKYRDSLLLAYQSNFAGNYVDPYIRRTPIKDSFYIDYVYLSDDEAKQMKNSTHEYLIEQVQMYQSTIPSGSSNTSLNLSFTNPVKDMFFLIQDPGVTAPYIYSSNLINLNLVLNGQDIVNQSALYLGKIQPMDYYTRTPTRTFYAYSFCIDPENNDPTGHVNFGRVYRQTLNLTTVPVSWDSIVRVYARSYNIFRIVDGKGTMLFNNVTI